MSFCPPIQWSDAMLAGGYKANLRGVLRARCPRTDRKPAVSVPVSGRDGWEHFGLTATQNRKISPGRDDKDEEGEGLDGQWSFRRTYPSYLYEIAMCAQPFTSLWRFLFFFLLHLFFFFFFFVRYR